MTDAKPLRITAVYRGRVQGVGFRATAREVAARFGVTGFVQNEMDGSVKCVVEGERGEIDRFLAAVRGSMGSLITYVDTQESAASGEFEGFAIRR
jgi:acylphosphatase